MHAFPLSFQRLFIVSNTLVSGKNSPFINLPAGTDTSGIVDNIFVGPGNPVTSGTLPAANLVGVDPLFANAAGYDHHLTAASPAIGKGVAPGTGAGYALTPVFEYLHPLGSTSRSGAQDLGAFQFAAGATGADAAGVAPATRDSGIAGADASSDERVAPSPASDAAGPSLASDAADTSPATGSSGCSCRMGAVGTTPLGIGLPALVAAALMLRRRRRRDD